MIDESIANRGGHRRAFGAAAQFGAGGTGGRAANVQYIPRSRCMASRDRSYAAQVGSRRDGGRGSERRHAEWRA